MRLIDTLHLGREHVIGAWLVDGVLIDPGPASSLDRVIEALGDERPRAIAVTHIHLDHAGGTGTLVRRWPEVEVWVHERGAPHLADPEKLLRSATRLYGDEMDRLWGEVIPVPEERITILDDEGTIGPLRYAYTPGHASHHVTYLHEDTGTAFTGDTAGVRIAGGPVMAPTPPPDIDLEAWERSLQRIESWSPTAVVPTHFGRYEDVGDHLAQLREYLATWGQLARERDAESWLSAWLARVRRMPEPDAVEQALPPEQQQAGLARYWAKREA